MENYWQDDEMRMLFVYWNSGITRIHRHRISTVLERKFGIMTIEIAHRYFKINREDLKYVMCNCLTSAFQGINKYNPELSSYSYFGNVIKNEIKKYVTTQYRDKYNRYTGKFISIPEDFEIPGEAQDFELKVFQPNNIETLFNLLSFQDILNANQQIKNTEHYWMTEIWNDYYIHKMTYKELTQKYPLTTTPLFFIIKNYNKILKIYLIKLAETRFYL